jgi:hypothetical protein
MITATKSFRQRVFSELDATDPITYAALLWIVMLGVAVLTPWRWLFRLLLLMVIFWLIFPMWTGIVQ